MIYLADANILSEATKPHPNPQVRQWLQAHEEDTVIDPIILGEIQYGILCLAKGRKRQQLTVWFEDVVAGIECLPWEAATAMRWAQLLVKLRAAGQTMPLKDSMVAATALTHGLTVATRNTSDFAKAGVLMVNPFD